MIRDKEPVDGINKKAKLLYIMELLLRESDEENGISIKEILQYLSDRGIEAERKSIYSDIEVIRSFGLPVETRKTKSFEYFINHRLFELAELKLLVDAVQSAKFITPAKSAVMIEKLEKLCSVNEAKELNREVIIAGRLKHMNESIYYNTDIIHSAINRNLRISFKYFEWGFSGSSDSVEKFYKKNGSTYTVSPYALTWDDENYYLIAYDSQEEKIKHYRVDKIGEIAIEPDRFRDGRKFMQDFNMAEYTKTTFSMYGGVEEEIRLEVKNELLGVIIDRFGKDIPVKRLPRGKFKVTITAAVSPTFFSWLFNFGKDIKVLSPKHVIDRYKECAKEICKQYKK